MNLEKAKTIVIEVIETSLEGEAKVSNDMKLLGGDSLLDSMKLVEVCLALEDIADENGFEFDWTSETAMSKSQSMFRTVESLATEFATQSDI
jgi:acyl carrier protein